MIQVENSRLKKCIYYLLLLLWLTFAILLSRQSGEETLELSEGLSKWLCELLERVGMVVPIRSVHSFLRNAAHIVIYLVLGFLMCRAFRLSFHGAWVLPLALVLCIGIGVLDEYQKAFIPGRHCHWNDVLLNCVSCVPGAIVGWFVPRRPRSKTD